MIIVVPINTGNQPKNERMFCNQSAVTDQETCSVCVGTEFHKPHLARYKKWSKQRCNFTSRWILMGSAANGHFTPVELSSFDFSDPKGRDLGPYFMQQRAINYPDDRSPEFRVLIQASYASWSETHVGPVCKMYPLAMTFFGSLNRKWPRGEIGFRSELPTYHTTYVHEKSRYLDQSPQS